MGFCLPVIIAIVASCATPHGTPIELRGGDCTVAFSPANGSILGVRQSGMKEPILRGGGQGLWHVRFLGGGAIDASAFDASSSERRFTCQRDGESLQMQFDAPEIRVVVRATARPEGVDLVGEVTPKQKIVQEFGLPGRLRFDPAGLKRFIAPLHPHLGIGAALNRRFFEAQPGGVPVITATAANKGGERASPYLRYESSYPPIFADFYYLETVAGSAAIYRLQPRTWEPWAGAKDHEKIFVPGRLAFGGEERGGWCERSLATYVPAGQTWRSPAVRLTVGGTPEAALAAYCRANDITRLLKDKFPPATFDKFRQAVLVKYQGNVEEQLAALDKLPVPSLVHFTDYLHGGFDKQYPDHLPPRPGYGTPQQFRALFDRAHQLGHLMMPYTNPTWWCDHPRGPTFLREGDAPLVRTLDGKLSYERYKTNDGYTTCLWHPAVRAANRATLRQFTEDYPVDILFQDQCGARGWKYDLNPAAPTPYAYAEGMLSLIDEDSHTRQLATEDGFDRVVNAEVQLCGFTFALVPGNRPAWARPMKEIYPPETWELYPVAQIIAHDKAALLHHDLGKFVTDRTALSWTLGLGFSMSYAVPARALSETKPRHWLGWLDRIQKSVCARYTGEPVTQFKHQQGDGKDDDGLIRATYGPVRLVANLGPTAREEAGRRLAPHGFVASAQGMVAGNLQSLAGMDFGEDGISFVTETDRGGADIWVYSPAGREVAAQLPEAMSGEVRLALDGQSGAPVRAVGDSIRFRLPNKAGAGDVEFLWHARLTAAQ
jgi:hypothetical protein